MGSSEARWLEPRMYKHLQGVYNSHYRLHTKYIKLRKFVWALYIYIKSKFGITHFAHNYTEPHM